MATFRPARQTIQKLFLGIGGLLVVGGGVALAILQPWKTPPPVTAEEIAARLELAAGEVTLELDGDTHNLLSGTPLPEGARVATGEGARALVRLSDGSRVYLDGSTGVELKGGLSLGEGRVWLDAPGLERGQEPVPHTLGEVTVALSEGGASLRRQGSEVTVYVADGLAIVTSPGGRTEVGAGERVTIVGSDAPTVEAVAFWDDWTGGMGDHGGAGRGGRVGAGSLYAVDRSAPPGSPALPLQIHSQVVKVVVRDDLAETRVDQRFFNPAGRDVEGYFWFTIPEGSQLVGFALETDGRLVEGEIVERKEAAAKYEQAVQRANDPAMLEWIDERTVRARIYPVPGLSTRRIVVRYQQLLTEAEGKLRYRYPLAGPPGKATASIEDFALSVDLGELAGDYTVATLGEARVEEGGRRVTMRRSGYTPRADFQLELSRKPDREPPPLRLSVLDPGGDQARYVMVRYTPALDFDALPTPPGEVVVVVDTSAAGDPAEYQTRLAVTEAFLRSLSEGDRFAVVSADVRAEVLYPEEGMATASPEAVSAALEALAEHGTGGATDLGAIFELALERVHGLEQPAVVYVGDGLATSGERAGDALAERLRRSMTGSRARLFTVGVGQEVDEPLLQGLARVGGGASLRVQTPDQAIVRALELSGALKTPTITDLRVELGEGLDDVFTSTTGKLSRGQGLVLLARTHHDLPEAVEIHGRLGGEDFSETHKLRRGGATLDRVVPRLWAAAYIDRLLGDSRGPEAVRGKILSLGLEYGLMSPYTSYLALDSEQAYAAMGIERRRRRFGGVNLTARNELRAIDQRARSRREPDAADVLVGFFSAPFGCNAYSKAEPEAAPMDDRAVAAGSRRKGEEGQAGRPSPSSAAADRPASPPAEDPSPPPSPEAAPGAVDMDEEVAMGEAEAEPIAQSGKPGSGGRGLARRPSGRKGKLGLGGAKDALGGLDRSGDGGGNEDLPALSELEPVEKTVATTVADGRGPASKKAERRPKRRPRRRRITSPVSRGRELPCSDASARGLVHRRVLWRKRLRAAVTMTDALEVYEASAGSCEIGSWKDQRTFLSLLQATAASEADIGLLLAHFGDEADAARYLARALLRRLVDPALVAAVDDAMFGETVDWAQIDRQILLAVELDDKLERLRDALARAPGDPQGELRMVELLVAGGRLEEAVARGRRIREQGMMTPGLAQSLGETLVAHGQTEQARRLFSEIVEFDPEGAASRRLLGDIFLRHGWYDGAYRQYEDLVELEPEDATATIRLARAAAGAGRVDEALRTLRRIAGGEGRPGADDPRRFARLHAAAYLGGLLLQAEDSSEIPAASVSRELRRLQLFEGPSVWTLLTWEDLEAQLVLTHADPSASEHLGEPLVAGDTGLFALPAPAAGLPELTVRHAGERMSRAVKFVRLTITFDGSKFSVQREEGSLPARESRFLATPTAEAEEATTPAEAPPDKEAPAGGPAVIEP